MLKLDKQVCFSLYAASRDLIKLYKPILDKYNLTYTQYVAMLVIWEVEKITFKELGKRLHLDSGTLTPVLKKLEAMELINKYRSKEDDRVVIVEITQKGLLLKEDAIKVPEEIICRYKGDMQDLIALKKYLDIFLVNLEES